MSPPLWLDRTHLMFSTLHDSHVTILSVIFISRLNILSPSPTVTIFFSLVICCYFCIRNVQNNCIDLQIEAYEFALLSWTSCQFISAHISIDFAWSSYCIVLHCVTIVLHHISSCSVFIDLHVSSVHSFPDSYWYPKLFATVELRLYITYLFHHW